MLRTHPENGTRRGRTRAAVAVVAYERRAARRSWASTLDLFADVLGD
ncbi:hypothetical protein [Microbacterium lacticum]